MSSNFLNLSGFFAGVDVHFFIPPLPPTPLPGPPVPNGHVVGTDHKKGRPWHVVSNVTTQGLPVLQSGWAMLIVPHVFIPILPPHPAAEPVQLACIIATSSSAPQLSVHSVTAEGTALLAENDGATGKNCDCGLIPYPSNVDVNLNTVTTTPTHGDYVAADVGMLLNGLYNTVLSLPQIPNPVGIAFTILQNIADWRSNPVLDPVTALINEITEIVQTVVDR